LPDSLKKGLDKEVGRDEGNGKEEDVPDVDEDEKDPVDEDVDKDEYEK